MHFLGVWSPITGVATLTSLGETVPPPFRIRRFGAPMPLLVRASAAAG
jgi:hypothetical protein